jgi:hypothetical protein
MRNASLSLVDFEWPPQPQARGGLAFDLLAGGERQLDAVCVPYPYPRQMRERPLDREKPRLFEAVVGLAGSDAKAATAFARSWGLLYEGAEPFSFEKPRGRWEGVGDSQSAVSVIFVTPLPSWFGQRLERWRRGGALLQEALELWRAACDNDRSALAQVVQVSAPHGRPLVRYRSALAEETVATTREPFLAVAGRIALAALINRQLGTELEARYDGTRPHRLRLAAKPRSLYAAAWLQLAESITRDRAKRCPRCEKTFIVSTTSPGTRADYCSGACRQAAYRRRVARRSRRA